MPVIRLEPIAAKLRGAVLLTNLLPPGEVPRKRAELRGSRDRTDALLTDRAAEFLAHYLHVSGAAWALLSAPPFASLARQYDELEEAYGSGGPPKSPIHDSYSVMHVLVEIPVGVGGETPMSVLSRLTAGSPRHHDAHVLATELARSHQDLYRAVQVEACTARIVPVRSGAEFTVHLTGPFLRPGDLFLGRVVRFLDGEQYIADSPYLLRKSEAHWLAYLERVTTPAAAPSPASCTAKGRSKQRGRGDRQHQAPRGADAEARLVRHLRQGAGPRYWPEFLMNAYAGHRNGIVLLAGVPDQPETQPHHEDFDEGTLEPDEAEFEAGLTSLLLDRLRRTLDEPLPIFRGETLRQLVRSSRSRADAISWLREQERILRANPRAIPVDLRPLWAELGLEYQGLDTDPVP